jgi:hypothetical protein
MDWALLYRQPRALYSDYRADAYDKSSTISMLACPAFQGLTQRTFVIRSPLPCEYEIKDGVLSRTNPSSLRVEVVHPPNFNGQNLLTLMLPHMVFADHPVPMMVTSPWFHRTPHTQQGAVIPGRFDVGRWYRPIHVEINMWPGQTTLNIAEEEPLAYLTFDTEKKVVLQQYRLTPELVALGNTCARSNLWNPRQPLWRRYKQFDEGHVREQVLGLIKDNIVR